MEELHVLMGPASCFRSSERHVGVASEAFIPGPSARYVPLRAAVCFTSTFHRTVVCLKTWQ